MQSVFPFQIGGVTSENKQNLLNIQTDSVRIFSLPGFFVAIVFADSLSLARRLLEDAISDSEFTIVDAD